MTQSALFEVALERMSWLGARQSVISANVANASVAGYRAADIQPFSKVVGKLDIALATSHAGHLTGAPAVDAESAESGQGRWETHHSGNNVNLENEMIKAAEVAADYRLTTSIMRNFHTMYLTAISG